MNKASKWLVIFAVLMLVSFIISGFFFLKSGLIDTEEGTANEEVVYNLELFNAKMNKFLGIPLNEENRRILDENNESLNLKEQP